MGKQKKRQKNGHRADHTPLQPVPPHQNRPVRETKNGRPTAHRRKKDRRTTDHETSQEPRKARKKAEGRTLNNKKKRGRGPAKNYEKYRRPRRAPRGAGGTGLPPREAQGACARARHPQPRSRVIKICCITTRQPIKNPRYSGTPISPYRACANGFRKFALNNTATKVTRAYDL